MWRVGWLCDSRVGSRSGRVGPHWSSPVSEVVGMCDAILHASLAWLTFSDLTRFTAGLLTELLSSTDRKFKNNFYYAESSLADVPPWVAIGSSCQRCRSVELRVALLGWCPMRHLGAGLTSCPGQSLGTPRLCHSARIVSHFKKCWATQKTNNLRFVCIQIFWLSGFY